MNIFLKSERHLDIEDLYQIIRGKRLNIGRATVFRTLKLLSQAGLAQEVNLGDGRVRYEHKFGHEHHDHLVCVRCGRFIEASDVRIEKLQEELCLKLKFKPLSHRLEIFGICRECRKSGGRRDGNKRKSKI